MPSRYVHLKRRDLDDAVRAYSGLPARIIAEKGGIDRINNIAKGELTCADSELIYRNMRILDYNADAYYMYRQG